MAITYQDSTPGGSSTWPVTSTAFTNAVSVGDLITFTALYVQGYGATLTFTDNVNTGGYTICQNYNYVAAGMQQVTAYKVCNASCAGNTLALTVAGGTNGDYCAILGTRANGFVNVPTPVVADITSNTGDSAGPATATGFNNSYANEYLLGIVQVGNNSTSIATPGGWSFKKSANNSIVATQNQSTSGNAISWSSTLGQSDFWMVSIVSFADLASAATASIAWIT